MGKFVKKARDYFISGEIAQRIGNFDVASSNYFKSLAAVNDFVLSKINLAPKDHAERFAMLKENFPDFYRITSSLFLTYRRAYTKEITSSEIIILKEKLGGLLKMQKSQYQQIKKLKNLLKKHLKNNIADMFIIGSSIKNKNIPRDTDIIVLFKEKNLKQVEETLFNIKEDLDFIKEAHIEPLFVDDMFAESIFLTILHEGFSVRNSKTISDMLNLKSYSIFSFNLMNLSKLNKVRFAQTLYGRNKDGLLQAAKGISLGQGSFMVQVHDEEIFKELMKKWKISYKHKRAFVSD